MSDIVICSGQILKCNSYLESQNVQAGSTLNDDLVQPLTVHMPRTLGLERLRLGEGHR